MMLLRPLGFLDVWALSTSLYRQRQHLRSQGGVAVMAMIDGQRRHPLLDKWTSLRNVISRGRRLAEQGALEMVRAEIEQLDPGGHVPWSEGEDVLTVHIALVTNPMALLYAGNEAAHVQVGQVMLVNLGPQALRSAVNFGDTVRIHLILTFRQRQIEAE